MWELIFFVSMAVMTVAVFASKASEPKQSNAMPLGIIPTEKLTDCIAPTVGDSFGPEQYAAKTSEPVSLTQLIDDPELIASLSDDKEIVVTIGGLKRLVAAVRDQVLDAAHVQSAGNSINMPAELFASHCVAANRAGNAQGRSEMFRQATNPSMN